MTGTDKFGKKRPYVKDVGVSDASGTRISPSTEEKQDEIKTALDTVGISNITDDRINPATSDKQLENDHDVNVSNMIPAVETDLATSDNQTDGSQKTQLYDAGVGPAELDNSTNSLQTIEYEHHEVHSGSAFEDTTYDLDLDSGDVLSISFKTPDSIKQIHMVAAFKSSSEGLAEILEAPTITVDSGIEQSAYNRNRTVPMSTSDVWSIETVPVVSEVSVNATITADGTVLESEGIGTGKDKGTSEARSAAELILARNTIYAFRITGSADNGNASIRLSWYEHTPKN